MTKNDYITHKIPKRDGSLRIIHEPKPELKTKQRKVLRYLQNRGIWASWYSHGFTKGRSTATNAKSHINKTVEIKADIKDYFPSITSNMLKRSLYKEDLDNTLIDEIIELCTLEGGLPQGAPTSPYLANIASKELDIRLAGLAKKYDAKYTRYADDMVFSSNDKDLCKILPAFKYVIKECGFKLNHKKTKVLRNSRQQIITGVVVNEKANIPRRLRRTLRARIHNLKCSIINGDEFNEKEYNSISGMIAYFKSVNAELAKKHKIKLNEIDSIIELKEQLVA